MSVIESRPKQEGQTKGKKDNEKHRNWGGSTSLYTKPKKPRERKREMIADHGDAALGMMCGLSAVQFNWRSNSFHSASPFVTSDSLRPLAAEAKEMCLPEAKGSYGVVPHDSATAARGTSLSSATAALRGEENVGENDEGRGLIASF